MRVVAGGGEKDLTELARKVFKLGGRREADDVARAVEALRRANPRLRPDAAVPAGEPVVVPEVEGLAPAADRAGPADDPADDLTGQLKTALGGVAKSLDAGLDEEAKAEEEADRQLARVEKELVAADPESRERVAKVREAGEARRAGLADRRRADREALAQLGKDLDELARAFGRG
ncbi:MAG: hypothetical protein K2X87_26125 [Gemmataceae bacterium]|nr:hypothetical protein [Gemmataceae bacterium]